jgi:polysaccharide export outer membrane protein
MLLPLFRSVFALALVSMLGACALPQDVGEERQILKGSDDPAATFAVQVVSRDTLPMLKDWPISHPIANLGWIKHSATASDPLIEAGDTVSLIVWDNDETSLLSTPTQNVIQLPNLRVSSKGTVFLPYADEVYIAKMTPDEARLAIQNKLLSIIPSAQVQLQFASGSNNSVELLSGVPRPGSYPLIDRSTTLTSVLALGGGIPSDMANPQINLSRAGKLYRISAASLLSNPQLDTTMRGGDKIFIEPEKRYFLSLGAAGKEAIVNFPRDRVSALDAMSLVGGVNQSTANPKGILILRDYPQSAVRTDGTGPSRDRMVFVLDLTNADGLFSAGEFAIQDRDLVLVTQSDLVNTKTVFGLIGSIFGLSNTVDSAIQNQGT